MCIRDSLKTAVNATKAIKKENPNAEAQIALCYTLGDAYTLDYWKKIAKEIESMGADSICIKDMAGLLVPYKATELVTALKSATKLPIQIHTHYTSGVASMTYMKAVEAGADAVSYTHLVILPMASTTKIMTCILVLEMMAVSYTHLDVYKRQPEPSYPLYFSYH